MNIRRFNKIFLLSLVLAGGLTSCNDTLEPLDLEYKEDPNFAPPHISDAWMLQEAPEMEVDRVYVYRDNLYNKLFTRTLGWNGGDGVMTVQLPDGHLFWEFNDSFYGVVDGETRTRYSSSFPRNTIMVQRAENGFPAETDNDLIWLADFVQTTDPNAPGYYKALTHLDHPKAKNYNDDGIAQDFLYWAGDGTVVNNKLQFLWNSVDYSGATGAAADQSTALATYSLDGKPGDPGYLKLESVDYNFLPNNPYGYGRTLLEGEDGHIYLYSAISNGSALSQDPIVARTTTNDLTSEWEYYVPNEMGEMGWKKGYPSELEARNSGIAPGEGAMDLPWVFKKGDWYYMCAQTYPFGREMKIMRSRDPWGPFTDGQILCKFPNPLDPLQGDKFGNTYDMLYMLNIHPGLSRDGEIVISTNTDANSGTDLGFFRNFNNPGSADWYRPFFFRVFKWERLFDQ